MRVNQNSYPEYTKLENKDYASVRIDAMFKDVMNDTDFFKLLKHLSVTFGNINKRYCITRTFEDAILTALPKIVDTEKHLKDIKTDCGVIFTDKGFSLFQTNPSPDVKLIMYGFTKECLTTYAYLDKNLNLGGMAFSIKNGKQVNDLQALHNYANSFLVAFYFINNCEIEQVIVKPNQKVKHESVKYLNESKSNLTILDCRWFTELINNNPFNVKGHYRWQPYGIGFSRKKLIWISDFEKSGYHRTASKELQKA